MHNTTFAAEYVRPTRPRFQYINVSQDLPLRLSTKAHRYHCPGEADWCQGDQRQGSRQDRVVEKSGFSLWGRGIQGVSLISYDRIMLGYEERHALSKFTATRCCEMTYSMEGKKQYECNGNEPNQEVSPSSSDVATLTRCIHFTLSLL
jgi:hypothetical protein